MFSFMSSQIGALYSICRVSSVRHIIIYVLVALYLLLHDLILSLNMSVSPDRSFGAFYFISFQTIELFLCSSNFYSSSAFSSLSSVIRVVLIVSYLVPAMHIMIRE